MLAIDRYLQNGFTYSEIPTPTPPERAVLDAFLTETKSGYCQHFSGAMALLLRMGGVPARVVTGFAPGGHSDRKDAWIVRDTDAHSWVEAWFDELRLGHARPDAAGDPGALADRGAHGAARRGRRRERRLADRQQPRAPAACAPTCSARRRARAAPAPAPAAGDGGISAWWIAPPLLLAALLGGRAGGCCGGAGAAIRWAGASTGSWPSSRPRCGGSAGRPRRA